MMRGPFLKPWGRALPDATVHENYLSSQILYPFIGSIQETINQGEVTNMSWNVPQPPTVMGTVLNPHGRRFNSLLFPSWRPKVELYFPWTFYYAVQLN